MTQTATTLTEELRDFVTTQAAEDAPLTPSERSYQAELVRDVLSQEVKPARVNELMALYLRGTKSARPL